MENMEQGGAAFYGTVRADPAERAMLESLGFRVGEYSARAGHFFVRGTAEASAALKAFPQDFEASLVQRSNPGGKDLSFMAPEELQSELTYLDYLTHSPEGREQGDQWRQQREQVLDELRYRDATLEGDANIVSASRYVRGALTVAAHALPSYGPRTYQNALAADITLAFAADFNTKGELLTKKAAAGHYAAIRLDLRRPCVEAAREVYRHLKTTGARSLNIAGNGIYTLSQNGFTQPELNRWLFEVMEKVHEHLPIERIRTGGQTGVDLAGAVVGVALGIETTVMMPAGYRQRGADGRDRDNTQADIEVMVRDQVAGLFPAQPAVGVDERWITPAVEVAHLLLRERVSGAAFDGEPFMHTTPFRYGEDRYIICDCYYHTVLFHDDKVAVFSREEGGMVPRVDGLPSSEYLDKKIRLPPGTFDQLWDKTRAYLEVVRRDTLVRKLPAVAQRLVADGAVTVVSFDSEALSPEIRAQYNRGDRRHDDKTAVCVLRDDGKVLVAFSDAGAEDDTTVRHEFLHVAQIWCSHDVMEAAVRVAAERGRQIAQSIVSAASECPAAAREIDWMQVASAGALEDGPQQVLNTFDFARQIYPSGETAALAAQLGLHDKAGVVAALQAHFLLEAGFTDWKGDAAREMVAYAFQADTDPVIEQLYTSAEALRTSGFTEAPAVLDYLT